MDCSYVRQPRSLGLEVQYIARGVMTFPLQPWVGPTTLENEWTLMLEDAQQFDPDALWFMGSDARFDGAVCSDRDASPKRARRRKARAEQARTQ